MLLQPKILEFKLDSIEDEAKNVLLAGDHHHSVDDWWIHIIPAAAAAASIPYLLFMEHELLLWMKIIFVIKYSSYLCTIFIIH